MEDIPINLESILEQAPKWTFAGDFTLLQWMKQISHDLENKAKKTTESLVTLNNNVKSTKIALDNVANSLTALQFGNQFVECRVQDDDETQHNANEANENNEKQYEELSSDALLNTFLNNNLKVLRNCCEKYSIDLEDSDDEETSNDKTCIYQPVNPYNDKPLPYIFGSKDWHSKWHVGIYENQQGSSYSGDELSETFSESPTASHVDDNESFESNTEWVSSNSIDNDNLNASIEVKNASSLQGSQPLFPVTALIDNDGNSKYSLTESCSVSTTPSSLAKTSLKHENQNGNLSQRSKSINSISSKTSSKTTTDATVHNTENVREYKPQTAQKFVDLFADLPEDQLSTTSSTLSQYQTLVDSNIIRKEISPFVDLFAEPAKDILSSSLFSNENKKRRTVNLFDEDTDKLSNNNFLPITIDEQLEESNVKEKSFVESKTSDITNISKSLFDDSDEDDDFLKTFIKKSTPKKVTNNSLTKALLFDDEVRGPTNTKLLEINKEDVTILSDVNITFDKQFSDKKIPNIFDGTRKGVSLFNDITEDEAKIPKLNLHKDNDVSQLVDNLESVIKSCSASDVKENIVKANNADKKANPFDDLDEEDDIFSGKANQKKNIFNESSLKKISEQDKNSEDDDSFKTTNNQFKNSTKSQNNFMRNEHHEKSNDVVKEGSTISSIIAKEIIENKLVTESVRDENHLIAKNQLLKYENQNQYIQEQNLVINNNSVSATQYTLASEEAKTQKKPLSLSNTYDFNSILFSDEPPEDDEEFFETLTKSPSAVDSTYNAIDLETDIFEPELPKVPAASTNHNKADTVDNIYTGLQLFSDIPPDDDSGFREPSNRVSLINQTKSLHSVFYDDFKETLMALNQNHIEKEISEHCIAKQEPPKDANEVTNSSCRDTGDKNNSEFSSKSSVAKLHMPNININIQALLPGASYTLSKSKQSDLKRNSINNGNNDITNDCINATEPYLKEAPRTAETEHILPNFTRHRVRAPSSRRPSTRSARQENYRRSLIEEHQLIENEDEEGVIQTKNNNIIESVKTNTKINIKEGSSLQVESSENTTGQKQNSEDNINADLTTSTLTASLFKNTHEAEHNNFNISNDKALKENTENFEHSLNNFKEIIVETKSNSAQTNSLGNNAVSGSNNTNIKITNVLVPNETTIKAQETNKLSPSKDVMPIETAIKSQETNKIQPFFDSEDDDNDLFKPRATTWNNDKNLKAKAQFKSFLDSETDEDDTPSRTISSIEKSNVSIRKPKNTNDKLFSDSETDSNDLFEKLSHVKTANNKISTMLSLKSKIKDHPQSSLFTSNDSDSDDFLTHSGAANKKTIYKSDLRKNMQTTAAQAHTSLFSDLDSDEDDLFGGATAKVSKTNVTNIANLKAPSTAKQTANMAEMLKSHSVDDNPLSDLL